MTWGMSKFTKINQTTVKSFAYVHVFSKFKIQNSLRWIRKLLQTFKLNSRRPLYVAEVNELQGSSQKKHRTKNYQTVTDQRNSFSTRGQFATIRKKNTVSKI